MTWWLRAHAAGTSAAALVACFLLAPLLSASALPVPALFTGNAGGVSVPLLLPALPACALLYGLARPPAALHATAVRPLGQWQLAGLLGVLLVALVIGVAEAAFLDFPLALGAVRNLCGYLAAGLVAQRLWGPTYGPAVAAALPVLCGLVGNGPGGRPYWWAWPLHTETSLPAVLATALLLCAAVPSLLRPRRP
ncbi:MAG: hypothetical protein ACRDP3_12730 [Streptomyces sp.]|uniref:hypothetical protein n=1 Tax=Streptomyces sp. TaxID=1931 RepID=UPI003D6A5E68